MGKDAWAAAWAAPTLAKVHEALQALRPSPYCEDGQAWRDFHARSAAVYREIADKDRGHHHEALYWANGEQDRADELTGVAVVASPASKNGRK